MDFIYEKIDEFEHCFKKYHLSTAGYKSPHNLCITSYFKNQPINTILDSEMLQHLAYLQNMPPASVHGQIVNPTFHI